MENVKTLVVLFQDGNEIFRQTAVPCPTHGWVDDISPERAIMNAFDEIQMLAEDDDVIEFEYGEAAADDLAYEAAEMSREVMNGLYGDGIDGIYAGGYHFDFKINVIER